MVPEWPAITSVWTAIPSSSALRRIRCSIQRVQLGPTPMTGPLPRGKVFPWGHPAVPVGHVHRRAQVWDHPIGRGHCPGAVHLLAHAAQHVQVHIQPPVLQQLQGPQQGGEAGAVIQGLAADQLLPQRKAAPAEDRRVPTGTRRSASSWLSPTSRQSSRMGMDLSMSSRVWTWGADRPPPQPGGNR